MKPTRYNSISTKSISHLTPFESRDSFNRQDCVKASDLFNSPREHISREEEKECAEMASKGYKAGAMDLVSLDSVSDSSASDDMQFDMPIAA